MRAAWEVFNQLGTDVPLEEVARRAGVGVATLYRRFPSKDELLMAVLRWRYAEQVEPVIRRALGDEDPWRAVELSLRASLEVAAAEYVVVRGLRDLAQLKSALMDGYFLDLATVVERAQAAGVVRADLRAADLPLVFYMIVGALRGADPRVAGLRVADPQTDWRRCLVLMLDGLRPGSATPMPED